MNSAEVDFELTNFTIGKIKQLKKSLGKSIEPYQRTGMCLIWLAENLLLTGLSAHKREAMW